MNNNNYMNLNMFPGNNSVKTNVVFLPQPVNIQSNGNNPNIFGPPLIPVVSEPPLSATQRIKQVENVIKREKEMSKGFDEKEVLKLVRKCDLHPHKLSEKCRKCKEVKKDIEKIEEERKALEDKRFSHNFERKEIVTNKSLLTSQNDINMNNSSINPLLKPFKTHGDPVTCNLNTLIHNNILSNQYFKELLSSKGFNETLDEIIHNAKYAEPWTIGTNGIPSTLFCCLYRLMLCHLSEGQVKQLLNNEDSVYIRCAGFLFIRYLCDPKDLWNWLSPYILDEHEFSPTANAKQRMTIGEYVEMLLREYDYYGTRLPRIPVTIERELKMKLLMIPEKRQRKKENLMNVSKFVPGAKCKAISSQDSEWHNGSVIELLSIKACRVFFTEGKEISLDKTENKWFNHEMFLMKVNEYKKQNNENNVFFSGEEIVDLGNIMLFGEESENSDKEIKKKRSKSKERERERNKKSEKEKDKERKRKNRSSSRSISRSKKKEKKNKHRSRSRERSPKTSKKDKEIYEKILEQERNAAVAKGRDYAVRPTSYKSSLSQAVPTGNQRKRSKSPELKQKIEIIQRKRSPEKEKKEEKEVSKEYLELQKKLKEKYGDSSMNEKNMNYYSNQGKKKDLLQPDVMKLGK